MMAKACRRAAQPMTAMSLILTATTAGAASLCELPTEVPCDRVTDTELPKGSAPREVAPARLGEDARVRARAQAAAAMGDAWPSPPASASEELRRLARDTSDSVRISAAVGLARAIERATAPERIDLVCSWALSEDTHERLALARALTWSTPVFVADLVLEQLACDESAAVRGAALAAVAKHFHENSAAYAHVVSQCLDDPDGNVRRLAHALMKRARA